MTYAPSSLRQRLVLGAVAVGITFSVVFGFGASWRLQHAQSQAIHAALLSRAELARDEVAGNGALTRDAGSPKTDLVQVVGADGSVRSSSPGLRGVPALVSPRQVAAAGGSFERQVRLQHPDVDLAVLGVPVRISSAGGGPGTGVLVVAVDVEGFAAASSDLVGLLLVGLLVVIVAIAALTWVITGRALRSVTQLTERAEAVRPRELANGLPSPPRDAELARLVAALNRMLARIDESHAGELAFAADAGHRLRTPVATLRTDAELALRDGDPAEQREALARIVQDADHLTSIVNGMLLRSRARQRAPEPVTRQLETAIERWRRQARTQSVSLEMTTADSVDERAACAALVDVLDPIVDNATRHSPADGRITLAVRREASPAGDVLVVDVANTGAEVPADLAPRIFDPWVSSRDASTAGGLGLWLARETARDSGGDVVLVPGHGVTTFRVTLPVLAG